MFFDDRAFYLEIFVSMFIIKKKSYLFLIIYSQLSSFNISLFLSAIKIFISHKLVFFRVNTKFHYQKNYKATKVFATKVQTISLTAKVILHRNLDSEKIYIPI